MKKSERWGLFLYLICALSATAPTVADAFEAEEKISKQIDKYWWVGALAGVPGTVLLFKDLFKNSSR